MSYITGRIAKSRAENEEYRLAYDEEERLLREQQERRKALMKRVTILRRAQHITQQAVAEAMGVSQARISQLERGAETLSLDTFLNLLAALGARVEILPESTKSVGPSSWRSGQDGGRRKSVPENGQRRSA